jgi:HAMP domain-containing protein
VTRVAREVGTKASSAARRSSRRGRHVEGPHRLGQRDGVEPHRAGAQHRRRDTAVARGDLSRKITVDVKGEILELKDTINTMVDQLNAFASEVSRVAREVGTEGKLGGRAEVPDVAAPWKDLTDSVNAMGANLTAQVRNIAGGDDRGRARRPVAQDHGRRQGRDSRAQGHHQHDGRPVERLRSEVTASRARSAPKASWAARRRARRAGTWKNLTDSVNSMASNLTGQVRNIAYVATVRSPEATCRARSPSTSRGEILELKNTINTMVDQLNAFASEVSRVAREVGTKASWAARPRARRRRARGRTSPTTSTRWRRT